MRPFLNRPLLAASTALAAIPLLACSAGPAGFLGGSTTHQTEPTTQPEPTIQAEPTTEAEPTIQAEPTTEVEPTIQAESTPEAEATTEAEPATQADPTTAGPNTGITVQGVGNVRVEPDMARLNIGVEVQADSVAEAREQAATAADDVIQSVLDNGVPESDVQTVGLNISARYDFSGDDRTPTLVGYFVSNTVSVTVSELDRVGEIIDEAAEAGGDAIRINGVQFTVEDASAAIEQAREQAMENARQNAEQLATAADIELGELLMISETTSDTPPPVPVPETGGDDLAPTPIQPGTESVQVMLTVRYAIQ